MIGPVTAPLPLLPLEIHGGGLCAVIATALRKGCPFRLLADADGDRAAVAVDRVEYRRRDPEDAPGGGGPPEALGGDDAAVLGQHNGGSVDEPVGAQEQSVACRGGVTRADTVRSDPAERSFDS